MKYFSIENSVDRVHGSVDRAASWSTVDWGHRARPELAERCHAAPKLTAAEWEGEGNGAELTDAKIGRHGGEVAPAVERNGTRRRCSVLGGSRHG
jgi:hypothetical protein